MDVLQNNQLKIEATETIAHTLGHTFELGYLTLETLNEHAGYWGRSFHTLSHSAEFVVGTARVFDGCIHAKELHDIWTEPDKKEPTEKNWITIGFHSTGVLYASCLVLGASFDVAAWGYSWLPLPTFFDRATTFVRSNLTFGRQAFYASHLAFTATKAGLALEEGPSKWHAEDPHQFQMLGFGMDFFSHCIEFGWLQLPFGGEQWTANCIGLVAHFLMLKGLWLEAERGEGMHNKVHIH
jgi:hypothetical protein